MLVLLAIAFFFGNLWNTVQLDSSNGRLVIKKKLTTKTPLANINGQVVVQAGGAISSTSFSTGADARLASANESMIAHGSVTLNLATSDFSNAAFENIPITFQTDSHLYFNSNVSLLNTWTINGNTTFFGNKNKLNIGNAGASISIAPGKTLTLVGLTLDDFDISKISFGNTSSTIVFFESNIIIKPNANAALGHQVITAGNFVFDGKCEWRLNDKNVQFQDDATFSVVTSSGALWVDNRSSTDAPSFVIKVVDNTTTTGYRIDSLIDSEKVRVYSDSSSTIDPGVQQLTSGQVPPPNNPNDPFASSQVEISSNAALSSGDQIVITNNTEVQGNGSSLVFANTNGPQIVVSEGKTATFGDIEMLRIRQSTFDLSPSSVIKLKRGAVLEFVEDVTYNQGTFQLDGTGDVILLRGVGGLKKITLTGNGFGDFAAFSLGTNTLLLEDIEIDGLERFSQESRTVGGNLVEGRLLLAGRAKINVKKDSSMNFLVRGEANRIVFQQNDLTLSGKIRYDNNYDGVLVFAFNLSDDSQDLTFGLEKNSLVLDAKDSQCTVRFNQDKVSLRNKSSSSFVVKTKSLIEGGSGGGILNILDNPIIQETENFSLGANFELQSTLLAPVEIAVSDSGARGYEFKGKTTRAIVIPRPQFTVKSLFSGNNLKKTVAVRAGGTIQNLIPSVSDPLTLILTERTKIKMPARRSSRTSGDVVRSVVSSSDDFTSTFKATDSIYVTGISNTIEVTESLNFYGKIIMDENAELIFQFDDSTSLAKEINFSNSIDSFFLQLPPSASVVFEGNGVVNFGSNSTVKFNGTAPEDQPVLADGSLVDDRPSLIFRKYAQMRVADLNTRLVFYGRGKVVGYDGMQFNVEKGSFIIGNSSTDFFDILLDKSARISCGSNKSVTEKNGYVSLSRGLFNLSLDRGASIQVKNGGVFSIGMTDDGQKNLNYTGGELFSGSIVNDSKLLVLSQGTIAFGVSEISLPDTNPMFSWDNLGSAIDGSGRVSLYTDNGSQDPFISGRIQQRFFNGSNLTFFGLTKGLIRVTESLINAADYVDPDNGSTKLITPLNRIVVLNDGDVIRREGPDTGNVYGTSAAGQTFTITP